MRRLLALIVFMLALPAAAETVDLEQAIARALKTDPRIEETLHFVDAARGLQEEVEGRAGWFVKSNSFLAIAPKTEGSIFKNGTCVVASCDLRDDRYELDGLSPWLKIQMSLIKPLYTFGKLENYTAAAAANIQVKQGDVQLQRNATVLDVKKAYYGFLAARDGRLLLADVGKRVEAAIELVQGWLDEGDAKQSDLYALQSGHALVMKFKAQAEALEKIALGGLKVLVGMSLDDSLVLADRRIRPLALPELDLEALQQQAMEQRSELQQLAAGLQARRSLVAASKANTKPDLYAGVAGILSYASERDRLENPFIYDPFNELGVTPVLGLRWNWQPSAVRGKTRSAEAELNALIAKSSFAQRGIPFQVAEQYYHVQGYYEAVQQLEVASRSARRWMISSYTDFEAGLEKTEKIMTAMQAYVLAMTDYLQTTFEYNMHVARLEDVTGVSR